MRTKRILVCVAILIALPVLVFARSEETAYAVRVETPPVVDGVVAPEEYPVEPVTEFTQFRPGDGIPPLERTEVYIVYDDDAIYFGWVCYEDKPGELVASAMVRDAFLNNDDSIDVMIDANNDLETSYDFMTNPLGTKYDGLYARDGAAGGSEWDGVWDVATSIGEDRWAAELRIPWENFTYSPDVSEMGLQLYRNVKPDYEDLTWAGDSTNLASIPHFGTLTGLEGLKPPKRFALLPYGTVRGEQYPSDDDSDILDDEITYDGGLDFEFNGGKAFTFNATLNPDYAHIEADPEEIQLDPQDIYLTEKRPFFTEANSVFSTGSDIEPLYTRSMKEILAGVKATGTMGRFSYGVMDVQLEKDDPTFPEDNVMAARLSYVPYEKSNVGALVVSRYGIGERLRVSDTDDYNFTGAFNADLPICGAFYLRGVAAKSHTKRPPVTERSYEPGKDFAYLSRVRYYPDFFTDFAVGYQEFGKNYQADVSFTQPYQLNRRSVWANGTKNLYFTGGILRNICISSYYTHWWRVDNNATIYNYWNPSISVETNNIVGGYVFGSFGSDGRFYMYNIRDYRKQRTFNGGVGFGTQTMSWGQITGEYWRGEYFGVEYNDYQIETTLIPIATLQFGLDFEITDPILDRNAPDYSDEADKPIAAANFRVIHNINEDLYWRAIVQGNTDSDVYLGSALVAWEYLRGSTAYVAYEERRGKSGDEFALIDRMVFVKMSYLLTL